MKKLFALLLAVVMVLGLVACAPTPADPTTTAPKDDTSNKTTTTTEPAVKVEFPLKEEVTLTITGAHDSKVTNLEKNLADNKLWQDLYKKTNVRIDWQVCKDLDTLTALLNTNNVGDIIITNFTGVNEQSLSDLITTGKLLDLTPYVDNRDLMPNLNERVFDVEPYAKSCFVSPDGKIYVLGSHNEDDSNYLESSCWINKTWLEDAGMTLEDVSTIEGLGKFFAWVKANDANGNGDPDDELPWGTYMSGSGFMESMLGSWGIPTKDQTNEGYVYLVDGDVKFAPLTEAWVDFMTTMADWNQKGYLYEDYLLGHDGGNKPLYEHWMNTYVRDNGEPERIAFWTNTGAPARNTGSKLPEGTEMCEYVSILPPKAEGYETRWYMHPGFMGTKNNFAISSSCETPEIALAWMDLFYSQEVTVRNKIGETGSKWVVEDAEGKLSSASLSNDIQLEVLATDGNRLSQICAGFPSAYTMEDYETTLTVSAAIQKKRDALKNYESVLNTEVWPRPYFDREGSETMTEIFGDIALVVKEYRADVLTGKKNLTSDYETFKATLEQARIEEFVEIMQDAYENFLTMAPQ